MNVEGEARRTTFGTLVDAKRYQRARPDYPLPAVAWMLGGLRERSRVLDLAAGTGKLSRALLSLGHEVVAVDPSGAMLTEIADDAPGTGSRLERLRGSAEDVPLPGACVDAVTVGQAWHWVRPQAAAAEVARVLRPGGVLGLAWNSRDTSVGWVAELDALLTDAERRTVAGIGGEWPRVPAPLTGGETARFTSVLELDGPDALADLASTESAVAVRHDREVVLDGVRELARAAADEDGRIRLPLVCDVFRFHRP